MSKPKRGVQVHSGVESSANGSRIASKKVTGDVIQGPSMKEIEEDSGTFVVHLDDGTRMTLGAKNFSATWKGHGKKTFPLDALRGNLVNSSGHIRVTNYDPRQSQKGRATLTTFMRIHASGSGYSDCAM